MIFLKQMRRNKKERREEVFNIYLHQTIKKRNFGKILLTLSQAQSSISIFSSFQEEEKIGRGKRDEEIYQWSGNESGKEGERRKREKKERESQPLKIVKMYQEFLF